jgi:hypothetical protein
MLSEGAMRRWQLLNRLFRGTRPLDVRRCILVVEQLEAREVPAITTLENVSVSLGGAFFLADQNNDGQNYVATLTATHGILDASGAASFGVTVSSNNTATVALTGPLGNIDAFLSSGPTLTPTPYYSGDATVTATAVDAATGISAPGGELPSITFADVQVAPVASNAVLTVNAPGQVNAPASGFVFPPGFITVSNWPDNDGSETVTVIFQLDVANPDAFTLSAGGTVITPDEPGQWHVSATNLAALQSTLDSLELTPPAGYTGFAGLVVFGTLVDQASYSTAPNTASAFHDLGFGFAQLRFFQGGSITAPTAFAQEGGTLDLGGRYSVSDPDELPGDAHTLTVSVPSGTLTFDPAAIPSGATVGRDGDTITINGTIAEINAFLAAPGSLAYSPDDAHFAGFVPLTLTLTNHPGAAPSESQLPGDTVQGPVPAPVTVTANLAFVPVADHVVPAAVDVETEEDMPVELSITLSGLAGIDGAESVLIVLDGVPAGATFTRGTDLGNGEWAFAPSDLAGLEFVPALGETGTVTFTVKAVVTDAVTGLPASTAAASTTFTVTVQPIELPTEESAPVESESTAAGTSAETDSADTADARPDEALAHPPAFINAYSSSVAPDVRYSPTETRVSLAPPSQGSLFAQLETQLPSYSAGERHPLPPVLPLDQTLPVAGFTESGGDSFALVDKFYRDAAAPVPPATGVSQAPAESDPSAARVTQALVGIQANASPSDALVTAPTDTSEESGGEWRAWAAAAAVVGSLAAWAWLSRGTDGFLARAVRRFLRTASSPTERTA